MTNNWPTQALAAAFYGDPRQPSFAANHLTAVECPWKLVYSTTPVSRITINKACAESLARVLASVWEQCGKSQAVIESHGYHKYSGSYNYRPIRGETSLSMHAYGCAIDWDAGENAMGPKVGRFKDTDILILAFKNEGWIWGGDWLGRKDGMHVQAALVHAGPVKTIEHPVTGKTFRLGRQKRLACAQPPRRFFLKDYLKALPTPPAAIDYSEAAMPCLEQVLCNDDLGCCTASGAFHIAGLVLGNAGLPATWTDAQVIEFYSRTTGYVPGNPATDQGGDELTVLDDWRDQGLLADGSHKIAGHLVVDGTNVEEIKAAMWLFENLYFGVSLPDAWINPMPSGSGFTWDVAGDPDDENGHCFVGTGYTVLGVKNATWGMLGTVTWAAITKYAVASAGGEIHVVLSPDMIAKASAKAPNGLDWATLVQDFNSLGGAVAA